MRDQLLEGRCNDETVQQGILPKRTETGSHLREGNPVTRTFNAHKDSTAHKLAAGAAGLAAPLRSKKR